MRVPHEHDRRRAIPHTFSLDPDAHALLAVLCPNSKGIGLLVSELVRREAKERAERPQLLARLATKQKD